MKRCGIQWDSTRINGRRYVHMGLYLDSPDKHRTGARVAAFITVLAFVLFVSFMMPDTVHTPMIDVATGEVVR